MSEATPNRRRQTRGATTTSRRRRRHRQSSDDVVTSLTGMVDQLIAENRQLKRDLARAERAAGAPGLGQAAKTLSGIQRRISRALTAVPASRLRRTAGAAGTPRPRRRVTDPEVLQRRRDALAKARAALAAKRQAGSTS
jgi:hypothetical protein